MVLDFIEFAFATFKYKKEWINYKVIPSFIRNILANTGRVWLMSVINISFTRLGLVIQS